MFFGIMYINIDIHVLENIFEFVYLNFELFRSLFPISLDKILHSIMARGMWGQTAGRV